jgi:hypothetical protein
VEVLIAGVADDEQGLPLGGTVKRRSAEDPSLERCPGDGAADNREIA